MKTNSSILNHITSARGERVIEKEDNYVTVGYRNVQFWIPTKQSWITASQDPDKFLICLDIPDSDHSVAWTEFYDRWRIYINKRFPGLTYCKIESTNN